jgi:hypothetical protein
MLIAILFTVAKQWHQSRCPTTDDWIKKVWYIYKRECYFVIEKNAMSFAQKWVELDIIMSK